MVMGCYGIGISRVVAAVVEEHHDEHGIIWPAALAPYDVHLVALPGKGDAGRSSERRRGAPLRPSSAAPASRCSTTTVTRALASSSPTPTCSASPCASRSAPRASTAASSSAATARPESRPSSRWRPPHAELDVVKLPVHPPVSPMLAKLTRDLPTGDGWLYEPKWDGFRCIVFRDGDEVELGSRNEKPLHALLPRAARPDPGRSSRSRRCSTASS